VLTKEDKPASEKLLETRRFFIKPLTFKDSKTTAWFPLANFKAKER